MAYRRFHYQNVYRWNASANSEMRNNQKHKNIEENDQNTNETEKPTTLHTMVETKIVRCHTSGPRRFVIKKSDVW